MNLFRFVPIKLTLFLVVGILLGNHFDLTPSISITIAGTFLILLTLIFFTNENRNSISFGLITALTAISLGILSVSLWQPKNRNDHYSHSALTTEKSLKLKIREVLKSNEYTKRYVALVEEINGQNTTGKIILNIPNDTTIKPLQVDQELMTYGYLNEIKRPLNPYQFDYRRYLEKLGIYHELKVDNDAYILLKKTSTTIYGIAASARNSIIDKLKQENFGKEELGIIQALLLGQRNSISTETYDNYKDAGAVHILAVSGLHIGILLILFQYVFRPLERLPKGRSLKLAAMVLSLWCFALLAGLSASVVRAVTMFTFVAYALYLNRPSNTFNILALSMFFILLLFNPMLLFQVGFQMSYVAVFSIIWIYPMLQRFWFPKNKIVLKIWQLLSVSLAAQLGVLPISLYYFHQFPGLFFISNILVVPFLGVILGMGILIMLLALFHILPDFLTFWYNGLIELMNTVIEWVAKQEAFVFKNISFDLIQLFLTYILLISLVLFFLKSNFKRALVFSIALITLQSWLLFSSIKGAQKEKLLLLHQTKSSILFHQQGNRLSIHTSKTDTINRTTTDFIINQRIKQRTQKPLKNSYRFGNKLLMIIDSSGIYSTSKKTEYLLLTQSPKINLERTLDSIHPKQIIADGSNYKSYIERWRKTCVKRKLPFHYTGEKGAYHFE